MKKKNIRDKELDRLIKYAMGLGTRITMQKAAKGQTFAAAWVEGGEEIILYTWPKQTKIDLILNLLHELGHHLDYISKNRTEDQELLKALLEDDEAQERDEKIEKSKRLLIYQTEVDGASFRPRIAKEVGLTLPFYKLKADMDLDLWIYKKYYENGTNPPNKEIKAMKKKIIDKYKRIYKNLKCLDITEEEL